MKAQDKTINWPAWVCAVGVVLVAIFLVFLLPYSSAYGQDKFTLAWRIYENYSDPNWTHCLFAPFVTAGLVWFYRDKWRDLPVRGSWIGLPILVFGFAVFWFGYSANIRYVGFVSLQILVAGGIFWFLGWRWFLALLLPFLFLGFCWPFPPLTSGHVTVKLREIMTAFTGFFLNGIGIDTYRSGTSLTSMAIPERGLAFGERFQIGVDNPCSGLRSLFALLMVGTIMAFVMHKKWWKRLILLSLIIPIAMIGNFGRLLALVFGTMLFGVEFAVGGGEGGPTTSKFHLLAGMFIFLVGSALLYAVALFMEKGFGGFRPRKKVIRRNRPAHDATS